MTRCGDAPVIETARLVLRAHRVADFEDLALMWADPAVLQFIGGVGSERRDSWMRLLRYGGCWPLFGYGYWAVRDKASGRYAGDVGFAQLFREIEPSIDGLPEGGWVFSPWAHGQGLASEALAAALGWLDAQGHARSVCLIDPGNAASLRLAGRHGYGEAQSVRFRDADNVLLTRGAGA
jgi:RimJ/RimL family protein N-acetyltransferase